MDYELKDILLKGDCRGVACSSSGELVKFMQRGVADLFSLVSSRPDFLRGASVADKVVGRGAAWLMVKGGVTEVYADVISSCALEVLRSAGVKVDFGREVPNIINRAGNDICPVEKLTANASSAEEAYKLIGDFIKKQSK